MSTDRGDSQVSAAPESGISAAPTMASIAVDSQVGATPASATDLANNDKTMASVGLASAQDFFGPPGEEKSDETKSDKTKSNEEFAMYGSTKQTDFGPPSEKDDDKDEPYEQRTPRNGEITNTREPNTKDKEKDLNPENQNKLEDLKKAGDTAYNQNDGDLAPVQKALQDQADLQGTNPDGSPKVQIHAYQTTDQTPLTSFYASFGNNRNEHEVTKELIDGSRRYGTEFPSNKAGYIGTVPGGNGPRV